MKIEMEERTHTYIVNGDIASISITELLKQQGIGKSYDGVNKEKREKSAEWGKLVHKDIENLINTPKHEPQTSECEQFLEWAKENALEMVAEQKIAIVYKDYIIAGTIDIVGFLKSGERFLSDHKNMVNIDREYVSWQLSFGDYMLRHLKEPINGKVIKWLGADKIMCHQYHPKTHEMTVHELDRVPDIEIEKMLDCYVEGTKYQRPALVLPQELQEKVQQAEITFAEIENAKKKAEARANELRAFVLQAMKEQNIKSWDSPNGLVRVTYVAPSESISIDSKKVKERYPLVYTECQKLTQRKEYLRVTTRESEDDEF